jgi:hypothetical protein
MIHTFKILGSALMLKTSGYNECQYHQDMGMGIQIKADCAVDKRSLAEETSLPLLDGLS